MGAAALAVLVGCGCAELGPARYTVSPGYSVLEHADPGVASAAGVLAPPRVRGDGAPGAAERPTVLEASEPVSLRIDAAGLTSEIIDLGLQDDGTLEVPSGAPGSPAGWYTGSPTPGERGPAVLLGHVNATDGGPGVFARLAELSAGDTVEVTRQDGSVAVFEVGRSARYAKGTFPTLEVYGNTSGAELRLITCDGYDAATGLYEQNLVVYASLRTDR